MVTNPPKNLSAFETLLGPKGFSTDQDVIAPWLTDWRGLYRGKAAALLSPANTEQVSAVVRIAAEHSIPLVPQGGNTSMVGGATPTIYGDAVILSLRRMDQIRSVDPAANIAVAEAGVILEKLHEAVSAQGCRFPLTLGAKGSATIGGLCSTNAGGTQVLRFGPMRKLVLGLEAVLPDGSIHDGLSALKKDTRGYDLNQLLVGAEGTLGVITAASLQLVPAVGGTAVGWFGVDSPQRALQLLRFLEARSGDAVESFELMPLHSLKLVYQNIAGTRAPLESDAPWQVLVDYVDQSPDQASAALEAHSAAAFAQGLVSDAALAANDAQGTAFWRIRDSMSQAERASGPAVQHDISVPVDLMPDFMEDAARQVEARFADVTAGAFGHLGDGNVHFHVRAPLGADAKSWRATMGKKISAFVYDLVTEAGGSISAEHGIGQMKRADFGRLATPARLLALGAIKSGLDPKSIMNPEKLVPLASETPRA